MIFVIKNKLTNFLLLSIFFHFFIFLSFSSFALLTKQSQELEVFIIDDSKSLKDSHKTEKEYKLKNKKTESKITLKDKTNAYSTLDKNQTLDEDIKVENSIKTNLPSDSFSYSLSTTESSKEGKGEKIIDTEFGTAYGPKFIHREIPQYPQIARRLGKEGRVVLRLTINEKGELVNIEVLESAPYGFTESALEAVKKSKFAPAIKDGKPIACRAILTIRFVLKN